MITLEQAFALVDEIARFPKPGPNGEHSSNMRVLQVVMPPPIIQGEYYGQEDVVERPTPSQVEESLKTYSTAKGIEVQRRW